MPLPDDLPRATFRQSPDDFVVEEIPAYGPSGQGEHLLVTFRKTGLTTESAVRAIAGALGANARDAGFAGMKDKHAVTTQTASFAVPIARDPEPLLAAARLPGIEILSAARHDNKLKPGHLAGNRFRIVLRGLDERGAAKIRERLEEIGRIGVPNAFGPQRFGRDGDNPERALAWIRDASAVRDAGVTQSRDAERRPQRARGPRDRREQRLLFSALQSRMFNQVLELRELAGTWSTVVPGDLAKKHDSGGLFLVPSMGPELEDAEARASAGGISATGPMFGAKMRWPEGAPRDIELQVLRETLGDPDRLEALRHLGEGTRRAFRLMVGDLAVTAVDDAHNDAVDVKPPSQADTSSHPPRPKRESESSKQLAVCFVLPKGGYATTVLARACQLVESRVAARETDPGTEAAGVSDEGAELHVE